MFSVYIAGKSIIFLICVYHFTLKFSVLIVKLFCGYDFIFSAYSVGVQWYVSLKHLEK